MTRTRSVAVFSLVGLIAMSSGSLALSQGSEDPTGGLASDPEFLAFAGDALPRLRPPGELPGGGARVMPRIAPRTRINPRAERPPAVPDPENCLIAAEICPQTPCVQFVRVKGKPRCDRFPSATPMLRPAR